MLRVGRVIIVAVVVAVSPVLAADTLESVEAKIVEQWEKVRSMSAKFTMTQNMDTGDAKISSTTKGTHEYIKDGERQLHRMNLTSEMVREYGGQTMTMASKIMMIDDGEFQYVITEMEQMPQPMAMKAKSDPTKVNGSGKATFDAMRKEYDLKLLPDATVDGKAAYAIEATPKKSGPSPFSKLIYHFCKDIGMPVKILYLDKDGKTIQEVNYADIELNGKIDRDRFNFKVPEGVQVMDMTQQG